jgi:hypothetical protein
MDIVWTIRLLDMEGQWMSIEHETVHMSMRVRGIIPRKHHRHSTGGPGGYSSWGWKMVILMYLYVPIITSSETMAH